LLVIAHTSLIHRSPHRRAANTVVNAITVPIFGERGDSSRGGERNDEILAIFMISGRILESQRTVTKE
jgi:hypothetical protein